MNYCAGAIIVGSLVVSACTARSPEVNIRTSVRDMSPVEAILQAADAAPTGVVGRFIMTIRETGRADRNRLYLNSEIDYRDQRNLSIAVTPAAADDLLLNGKAFEDDDLKGRDIAVDGIARRVRINFTHNGLPTGKYYYQTHVAVIDAKQVMFWN